MKTLLITRPRQEAKALADALRQRGFAGFTEPLLRMTYSKKKIEIPIKCKAILTTSRHAFKALEALPQAGGIALFVVGAASAEIAKALGFTVAGVAETAQELIAIVAARCRPDGGPLFYARGKDIGTDIATPLVQAGFSVLEAIVYRALPATRFSETLRKKLLEGEIGGALFFSRRTAATYASLALRDELENPHRFMHSICMSEAVAEQARHLPWRATHIAPRPDLEAMLEITEKVFK